MQVVADAGLVVGESVVFAHNRLAVVTPEVSPVQTLEDLAAEGVLLVLAGPEVPVGRYFRDALARMNAGYGEGFSERALTNVVSEEPNLRQVVAKVALGEADATIVFAGSFTGRTRTLPLAIYAALESDLKRRPGALRGSCTSRPGTLFCLSRVCAPTGGVALRHLFLVSSRRITAKSPLGRSSP